MCFADLCELFRGPFPNPGGWGQILAYMAFCEVSQEQTPGTDAYAGDWIQGVLRFWPGWEDQKTQCRNRQRKTCDDGHHRHVFPGADRVLCDCLFQPKKKRKTTKSVAEGVQQYRGSAQQNQQCSRKKHNSVSIRMACSEFLRFIPCQPCFQNTTCLTSDCLILFESKEV